MASSFDCLLGMSIDGLFLNYAFREVPLCFATATPSSAMVSSVQVFILPTAFPTVDISKTALLVESSQNGVLKTK